MKKLFSLFSVLAVFALFSFVSPAEDIKKNEEKPDCTVTCTVIMADGTVYTATAGNWFSTCAGAERRCKAKLFDQIFTEL